MKGVLKMKHCVVTEVNKTREFLNICGMYYCKATVRKYDRDRNVVIVECNPWTWMKIKFWEWINNSPELQEEIEGTL